MTNYKRSLLKDIDIEGDEDGVDDVNIEAVITDGYSFKNLIDLFKNTVRSAIIVFDKDGISIVRGDDEGRLIIRAVLRQEDFLEYKFECSSKTYSFPVNFDSMRKGMKAITKKESALMIRKTNEKDALIVGLPGRGEDIGNIRPAISVEEEIYPLPPLDIIPNFKTSVSFFYTIHSVSGQSPDIMRIQVMEKSIRWTGIDKEGEELGQRLLGKQDDSKEVLAVYTLDTKRIKAIVKINVLNPMGDIKYRIYPDSLALSTKISTYGELDIILRNPERDA